MRDGVGWVLGGLLDRGSTGGGSTYIVDVSEGEGREGSGVFGHFGGFERVVARRAWFCSG